MCSSDLATSQSISAASQPVTFTESAPNTGVFGTYDENDNSVLEIASAAARGKSASFDFNQKKQSVVVGFGSATVSITPTDAEWNGGEKIPVTVVDSDANTNSRTTNDLHLNDASSTLIPSLRIGSPFTLGANGTETTATILAKFGSNYVVGHRIGDSFTGNGTIVYIDTATTTGKAVTVNKFSEDRKSTRLNSSH